MYNYCTYFDTNYLSRGLAMYESLKRNTKDFHLYILTFDEKTYEILDKLELEKITLIPLQEFEDSELLAVKKNRSKVEYMWTCTPSITKYVIEKYKLESCTYLDADIYFFDDPSALIEEMRNNSISIIPHRYTPKYDQSATSGIYCVQFMTFKNDEFGMKALNWWRNACINWCYARVENGKFGDQKYLDDWPERFRGVHVLQHLGGGVAPWNVQQYDLFLKNSKLFGIEKKTGKEFNLIFYHFHGLRFLSNGKIYIGYYKLNTDVLNFIYKPYLKHLEEIKSKIWEIDKTIDCHGTIKPANNFREFVRYIKRRIQKHIYKKEELLGG